MPFIKSRSLLLFFTFLIASAAIGVQPIHAADVIAASCSQANVQAAVNLAVNEDRVVVPAGACTWTSTVSVSGKNITLQGAGKDATVITFSGPVFAINLNFTTSRVTGFGFIMTAGQATILARGQNFRVDHNRFANTLPGFLDGVRVSGDPIHPTGVVDHNEFLNTRIIVIGDAGLLAHGIWSQPSKIGDPDQTGVVYVEDNSFDFNIFGNAIDTNYGGRYVFRHNTLMDLYIETHSVQGNHRGTRSWEIYNNTFVTTEERFTAIFMRGGTGVVFNNTMTGAFNTPIVLDNVRSFLSLPFPPGGCNGTSPWDGNTLGEDGWPCRDQIGRGVDDPGTFPQPQASEPAYFWSNTSDGSPVHPQVDHCDPEVKMDGSCNDIVSGRDFFTSVSTPRPGYSPFMYPHPLAEATTPVPGNSGTITTSSVGSISLTLNWTKATDNVTTQSGLKYEVRQSLSNNINTLSNAEANGTIIRTYTADIGSLIVTGLNPSTTYFFNVIVKDAAGNKSVYVMKSETTLAGLSLSPSELPSGSIGTPYSQTITASGAAPPFTFGIASGALPLGLVLNTSTGVIYGTPTFPGAATFSVSAVNASGSGGVRSYTIRIAADFSNNISQTVTGATYDSTPFPGFEGRFTINLSLRNESLPISGPMFFKITDLRKIGSDGNTMQPNMLLSADNGGGVVGDIQTLALETLENQQSTNTVFEIGLGSRQPFAISVALFGVPAGIALTVDEETFQAKAIKASVARATLLRVFNFEVSETVLQFLAQKSKNEAPRSITNLGVITGPGAQSRAAVAVDPIHSRRVAVAANDTTGNVLVSTTEDGGDTWHTERMSRTLGNLSFFNAQSPSLSFDSLGRLSVVYVLSNMNDSTNAVVISESTDGVHFNPPSAITFHTAAENVIVSRPVIASTRRGGRYVAWENFGSRINVVRSEEGGLFGQPVTVVKNAKVSSPTLAIGKDEVYIGWDEWGFNSRTPFNTGGRLMMASSEHKTRLRFDEPQEIAKTNIGFSSAKIRALPILPFGVSPNLTLAVDPDKEKIVYAAFADRGDGIDVRFARSLNRGKSWEAVTIKKGAAGGDQFSPAMDVDSDSNVYISFYDSLNSQSSKAEVFVARSSDANSSNFREILADFFQSRESRDIVSFRYEQITTAPIEESRQNLGTETATNLGDRTALAVSSDRLVVAWTDTRRKTEDIYLSILSTRDDDRCKPWEKKWPDWLRCFFVQQQFWERP